MKHYELNEIMFYNKWNIASEKSWGQMGIQMGMQCHRAGRGSQGARKFTFLESFIPNLY